MDLQDLARLLGYGQGSLGTSDYSSAVESGQTGTTDPQRAGIAPQLGIGGATQPRVLAQLQQPGNLQSDAGLQDYAQMPVAPRQQPSQDDLIGAASQNQAQPAQYTPPSMPQPMAPQPSPMMPQGAPSSGNPYSPLGVNSDAYAKLMQTMLGDVADQQKNRWSDALLRFGLGTMAAGGKPMSTTLGAIGEGGLAALNGMDEGRAAQLKALLGGAQISNVLGEAALRGSTVKARENLPGMPGSSGISAQPVAAQGQTTLDRATPNITASSDLPIQARAFLDTIAGPESKGEYDVRYTPRGGAKFASFDAHPNVPERGPEGPSTAAGRYQIVKATYDKFAPDMGASDFRPETQDHMAWAIAQKAFQDKTGGDLLGALQIGDLQSVQSAMRDSNQWKTADMRNYQANLAKYTQVAQAGGQPAMPNGIAGSPAASGGTDAYSWDKPVPGANFTTREAVDYGHKLIQAGYPKEAAEPWLKFGDPQFNPLIAGNIAGTKKAAEEAEKIEVDRNTHWVLKGGRPMYRLPAPITVTDAKGNEYPGTTPTMTMGPGGVPQPMGGPQGGIGAPPAPGAMPTAAPPAGALTGSPSKVGPGIHQELTAQATAREKQAEENITRMNSAFDEQSTIKSMASHANGFVKGPFAPFVQDAARYLRLIDSSWDGQVKDYETFVKDSGQLTRKAVHDTSSKAAVQEYQMIQNTLPNPEMSPKGLQSVQNELLGLSDYRIAKGLAQQQYRAANNGSVDGFETHFAKNVSPYAFVVARMAPEDRKEVIARLKEGGKQGEHDLAVLQRHMQFMTQQGLGGY